MEITWKGHSCLRIRSGDTTLITDPYEDSLGLSLGHQAADIVTVSHSDPHHSNWEAIEGSPRVLSGPGEYEIGNFYITGVGTSRGEFEGQRALNTAFVIQAEGLTLCHLGDLGQTMTSRQVDELGRPQILCPPAGGVCTIDATQVAGLISIVAPRIVVPLHYLVDGVTVELQPIERFLLEVGGSEATRESKLQVTQSNLPLETRIVILQRTP